MLSDTQMQEQEAGFKRSLQAFEQCVDTPFVPGELKRWMDSVAESFDQLSRFLQRQTQQVHSAEFRDIAREDPGLLQRVNQMQTEDRAIVQQQQRLAETIVELAPQVRQVGADEAALRGILNQFVADAQRFVSRVRKQEVAVRTWWVEAYTRDRGTVD